MLCRFGCARSTISVILKEKEKWLAIPQDGQAGKRIRHRDGKFPKLEECLALWHSHAEAAKLPTSDRALQIVARDIGAAIGIGSEELKFSSGWLQGFKARFGLHSVTMHGEAASSPLTSLDEERTALKRILSDYNPKDIFNADETGLFYRMPPNRTLSTSSNVSGHKKDKSRITVLLGCNATGSEKLKPLVIGTAFNPRPFKNINRALLPVEYHANKKAWMRSDIFFPWLYSLNRNFSAANRHVLLLIDNAPSHFVSGEIPKFCHLKVHCLPPNCTTHLQPMDAGIINSFKVIYKCLYLLYLIECFEDQHPADASSLHKINIRQAINFISDAWDEVSKTTIVNCWRHTGILPDQEPTSQSIGILNLLNENNIQSILEQIAPQYPGTIMTAQEFFETETSIQTDQLEMPTVAEIVNLVQNTDQTNTTDDEEGVEEPIKISMSVGMEHGMKFLEFLEQQENIQEENVISIRKVLKVVDKLVLDAKKQTKVTDFLANK